MCSPGISEKIAAITTPIRFTTSQPRNLDAEGRAEELQKTLNYPGIYKDRSAEVPGLVAALEATRAEIDRLYARWQELEALPKK